MRNLLIIIASVFMFVCFVSCNYDNKVTTEPDHVVLKCGESETINLIGEWDVKVHSVYARRIVGIAPSKDTTFSVSNIERKSLVVTGEKVGTDTLVIMFMRGIHVDGVFVEVPITVVE